MIPRKLSSDWVLSTLDQLICHLSAHADRDELTAWLEASKLAPKRVFVTHGEPAAARAFSQHLTTRFGWDATVPADGASFPLGAWDQQA